MAGLLAGLSPLSLPLLADHMRAKRPFETPYDGDETTRAARRTIDEDIDKLEVRIQSLRRRRNELSSISILPPEVLSKIFIFVRDMSSENYYRNNQAQWIRVVGHVCHLWRDVALRCPTLWSAPLFTNPELAEEMMHRSKMAALTIKSTTGSWTPRLLCQLEHAIAQISRIRVLHLTLGSRPDKIKNILSPLSQAAPLLEKVTLMDATYHAYNSQYLLPEDAFTDAPRLRSIELERLSFSWESAIFKHSNVTVLRLKNNRAVVEGASTFGQMIDALVNFPNLRILELCNTIPSHITSSGNEQTVDFRFLEHLTIDAKAPDCILLLRCIQYPPNTIINLRCSGTKPAEYTSIISLLGQALRRSPSAETGAPHSPPTFRVASLEFTPIVKVLLFDKSNCAKRMYSPLPREDPIISLQLDGFRVNDPSNDHALKDLCNSFDLSSLRALVLNWSFGYNQVETIRNCLGRLPKLKYIHTRQCVSQLCLAIKENLHGRKVVPIEDSQEGRTRHTTRKRKAPYVFPPVTVFPALKALVIDSMDFRQSRCPQNLENLVDMLMQRSDMNAPIHELVLDGCIGLRAAQKRRLGEVVVDLQINGENINVSELDSEDDFEDEGSVYSDEEDEDEDGFFDDYFGDPYYDFEIDDGFGWFPF